jgi:predicted Zn-dependent peptidase
MGVQITRLDNGIHVITHELAHLETVALGIWVRAGARDEAEEQNGIAHFLEHMAFKGTHRRSAYPDRPGHRGRGRRGQCLHGHGDHRVLCRVLKEDWRLGLDILADILTDPVFDPAELARERDVILQEIAAANDTPDDLVFDLAQAAAFPAHALGRPILGACERVAGHDADAMMGYRLAHYSPASAWWWRPPGASSTRRWCRRPHGFSAPFRLPPRRRAPPPASAAEPRSPRPLDQTHVVLTFPAVGYHHDDVYVLQVLSMLLGGGMSSRLFQEVREKRRGLCYSVFSCASAYEDIGLLSVYAATAPDKADELINVASDTMLSMIEQVDEAEVARAKAQLKAGLVMSLESASARANQLAASSWRLARCRRWPPSSPRLSG